VSRSAAVLRGYAHDDVGVGVTVGIVESARVVGVPARDVLLVKVELRVQLVRAVSGGDAELRQVLLSRLVVRALDVVLTISRDRQRRRGFGRDEQGSDYEEIPQPVEEGSRASRVERRGVH
jgi:hypothetical protein